MSGGDPDVEARIEQLVELEQELKRASSTAPGSGGSAAEHPYADGTIAGASKVPASEVPADYPVDVDTEQALRIDVDVGPETVRTYMEWAVGENGRGHVGQLLDALDRDPGEFADVFGDRVALDRRDGYYGIDADRTETLVGAQAAREDSRVRWLGRLLAGLVGGVLVGSLSLDFGSTHPIGVLFVLFPAIPLVLYLDQRALRTHLDWRPNTWAWIVSGLVPFFGVSVGAAYLVERASRLRVEVPGTDPPKLWFHAVVAGSVLTLGSSVALFTVSEQAIVYFVTAGFLTAAVYFDAVHMETAIDWPSDPLGKAAYTGFASAFLAAPLYAAVYLHGRRKIVRSG